MIIFNKIILNKKEYNKTLNRLNSRIKEIDKLTVEKRNLQRAFGMFNQIVKKWKKKEIGNLKAITELAKWFEKNK
tara:strand:+ start:1376 stop:1600 length:225 start_codon:yes stop_codon:yes gene_type:complete